MKNTKSITIEVPSQQILNRINSIPTFNRLSRLSLKVGKNTEVVNHKQYADMVRLFPLINVKVYETLII